MPQGVFTFFKRCITFELGNYEKELMERKHNRPDFDGIVFPQRPGESIQDSNNGNDKEILSESKADNTKNSEQPNAKGSGDTAQPDSEKPNAATSLLQNQSIPQQSEQSQNADKNSQKEEGENAQKGEKGNAQEGGGGNAQKGDKGTAQKGEDGNAQKGEKGNAQKGGDGNAQKGEKDNAQKGEKGNAQKTGDENTQKGEDGNAQKAENGSALKQPEKQEKAIEMSREKYNEPVKSEYAKKLLSMSLAEIYDNYNPGPSKPDGTFNYECHCVGHLVASPCGYFFRKAVSCQKAASAEALEKGECTDEFGDFMLCAVKTKCFRVKDDEQDNEQDS